MNPDPDPDLDRTWNSLVGGFRFRFELSRFDRIASAAWILSDRTGSDRIGSDWIGSNRFEPAQWLARLNGIR